jgi:uncharacterized membrane protein YhaH (DUF805 family)
MKQYLTALKKYFDFKGRASRKEFWLFALFNTLFVVLAIVLDSGIFGYDNEGFGPLVSIYFLATLIPGLSVSVRRFHDIGLNAWSLLFVFIPLVNLWIIGLLMFKSSDKGSNKYGDNPYGINSEGVSKEDILAELKKAKEKLDLQLITQEDYDKIKEKSIKYI